MLNWLKAERVVAGGNEGSRPAPSSGRRPPLAAILGVGILFSIYCSLASSGCGGSGSSSSPSSGSATQTGAFLLPILPPFSPDSVAGVTRNAGTTPSLNVVAASSPSASPTPNMDHAFFLLSGHGLSTPVPGLHYIPVPASTPLALTVNSDNQPSGTSGPNGGTGVHLETLNGSPMQLWKAVPVDPANTSPTSPFYLRSSESFATNPTLNAANQMVGFGMNVVALDLGYLSNNEWNSSIYLNPTTVMNGSTGPLGYDSTFLQWTYSPTTGQLNNGNGGQAFYDDTVTYGGAPTVGVAVQSPSADNTWYAFPNYYATYVINQQPNANPPFPTPSATTTAGGTTDVNGEQAAYQYLSNQMLCGNNGSTSCAASTQPCSLEGTQYNGIRCQYTNLNENLATCITDAQGTNPGAYNGTTISAADWSAVSNQVGQECSYANNVRNMYGNFQTISNYVFTSDSISITELAADVGVSDSQQMSMVPLTVVEDVLNVALAATGDPAAGAFAALMDASVAATINHSSSSQSSLTQAVVATVSDMESNLQNQFAVLNQNASNGVNAVLEDWGRMQIIGQLSEVSGYNGLALTSGDVSSLESTATRGYKLSVMEALMPIAYKLNETLASTTSTVSGPPGYDQYSYSTFGYTAGSSNVGYFFQPQTGGESYPTSQVVQTDILGNGANPFEVFSGLNYWRGLQLGNAGGNVGAAPDPITNFGCNGMVTTIFNVTPEPLTVTAAAGSGNGVLAAPGQDFFAYDGEVDSVGLGYPGKVSSLELRPFGFLPIWSGTYGGHTDTNLNIAVTVDDQSGAQVEAFNFGMDGCKDSTKPYANNFAFASGYVAVGSQGGNYNTHPQNWSTIHPSQTTPGGLWTGLGSTTIKACGVNCP